VAVCARQAYVVITLSKGDAAAAATESCSLSSKLTLPDLAVLSLCAAGAFLAAAGMLYFSAAKRSAALVGREDKGRGQEGSAVNGMEGEGGKGER
jgi:hypothetical protein